MLLCRHTSVCRLPQVWSCDCHVTVYDVIFRCINIGVLYVYCVFFHMHVFHLFYVSLSRPIVNWPSCLFVPYPDASTYCVCCDMLSRLLMALFVRPIARCVRPVARCVLVLCLPVSRCCVLSKPWQQLPWQQAPLFRWCRT